MSLQTDLSLPSSKFTPGSGSDEIKAFNEYLMNAASPKWFEVGAAKYRAMRNNGETIFPPAVLLDRGKSFSIPSREEGREIPCRMMVPEGKEPKAVFMYIHGGGFVLSSETETDRSLSFIADNASVAVISIGYRLAPEHPFPAGPEDCQDTAEWLIDNAPANFGASLQFIGGESAGGNLTLTAYLHLCTSRPSHTLSGLILNYGIFDLSFLPSVHTFKPRAPLILDKKTMTHYRSAFCPSLSDSELKHPSLSPFYFDFASLKAGLVPAMFSCGTEDCLLDDSVMMAAKWQMHGAETVLRLYPGAPHAFTLFPFEKCPEAKAALEGNCEFVRRYTR
ncbi:MAG: hypothetical protein Q9170_003031 [Blastenia crenularia]